MRILRGRVRGLYHVLSCHPALNEVVEYNVPARAYRLVGNGQVLQVTAFLRSNYEDYSISVYRGCIDANRGQDEQLPQQSSQSGKLDRNYIIHQSKATLPTTHTNTNSRHHGASLRHRLMKQIGTGETNGIQSRILAAESNTCVPGHSPDGVRWFAEQGVEYTLVIHAIYRHVLQASTAYMVKLEVIKSVDACASVIDDLGSLSAGMTASAIDSARSGSVIHNLPDCNNQTVPLFPARLYTVKVKDANVKVRATLEGDASIAIYEGDCETPDPWRCILQHLSSIRNRQFFYRELHTVLSQKVIASSLVQDEFGQTTEYPGDFAGASKGTSHYNIKEDLSWRNLVAETLYTIVVTHCCGPNNAGDFRLTVNVSSDGNLCSDAKIISIDNYTDTDTLIDKPLFHEIPLCYYTNILGRPMATYTFVGTGDVILATLDDENMYSTHMMVYVAASCEMPLACVGADYYSRSMTVSTEKGQTYFVIVARDHDNLTAPFTLSITAAKGDLCADSVDLGLVSLTRPTHVTSSTIGGAIYYYLRPCGYADAVPGHPAKVFTFQVETTGDVVANIRSLQETSNYFQTQAFLFHGTCNSVRCHISRGIFDEGTNTESILWQAKRGSTYHLIVMGNAYNTDGSFEIAIEMLQYGNACEDATPLTNITNGLVIPLSNEGKNHYKFMKTCTDEILSRAVVLSFELSEPHAVRAEVGDYNTNARLNIFKDTARRQACNQDRWECFSNEHWWRGKSFNAESYRYFVVVDACCGPNGKLNESLSFLTQPSGNVCDDVNKLGVLPDSGIVVLNNTFGMPYYDSISCQSVDSALPTVVYAITAKSTGMLSAVAMVRDGYSALSSVYSGSCNDLSCVAKGSAWAPAYWNAMEGSTYFVAVHQDTYDTDTDVFNSEGIDFALSINQVQLTPLCATVQDLGTVGLNGLLVSGSTRDGARLSDTPPCYENVDSRAVVYSLTASESGTLFLKADSLNMNASIAVYGGECSQDLTCVGEYAPGSVMYSTGVNETVHIVLFGCCADSSVGEFTLQIVLVQEEDVCLEPDDLGQIPAGQRLVVVGSTKTSGVYSNILSCDFDRIRSRAKAYTISARNAGGMYAEVVPFGTQPWNVRLAVFRGSCDHLSCSRYEMSMDGRSFMWIDDSEAEVYHIIVYSDDVSDIGDFFLKLESIDKGDVCTDAINLGKIPTDGLVFQESITTDGKFFRNIPPCFTEINSPLRIFKITTEGNGMYIASVVSNHFNVKVSVFRGACNAEMLECVSFGYGNEVVYWSSGVTESFYVTVYGFCSTEVSGGFILSIDPVQKLDPCSDVIDLGVPVSPGLAIRGNMEKPGSYSIATICNGFYLTGPGMLYKLEGTGGTIVASLSSRRMSLTLLESSCDNFICNHNRPIESTGFTWRAEKGVVYHLLVFSPDIEDRGDYVLSVLPVETANICDDIETLSPFPSNGYVGFGTTVGSNYVPELIDCIYEDQNLSPAKMYSLVATSDLFVSISVHSSGTDAFVSVFRGGCDKPITCVARGTHYTSWTAEKGENYIIAVMMSSGPRVVGEFFWEIQYLPKGSFCDDAIDVGPVAEIPFFERFSTEGGRAFSVDNCFTSHTPGGAFKIIGTGGYITASISNIVGGSYYAHLALVQGNCSNLECILEGYRYQDFTWETKQYMEYYIAVHGCCGTSIMSYDMQVFPVPIGDMCSDLITVDVPFDEVVASPPRSTAKTFTELNAYDYKAPAVIFSLSGTGDVYVAITEQGIALAIFEGNCTHPIDITTSLLTWSAEVNTTYFVAAFPYYSWDGSIFYSTGAIETVNVTFRSIKRVSPCNNDFSTDLGVIPDEGFEFAGFLGTEPIFDGIQTCSMYDPQRFTKSGAVVTMTGNGKGYTFSLTGEGVFNPRLSVYNGPCDALECEFFYGAGYITSFSLMTEVGKDYTIHIDDCCTFTGESAFYLKASPLAMRKLSTNGIDDLGIVTSASPLVEVGSATAADLSNLHFPDCFVDASPPLNVYLIRAGNSRLTALITGLGLDAQLSVLTRDNTGSYICRGAHDVRRVSWESNETLEEFFIVVHGCCEIETGGVFVLRVNASPFVDRCDAVVELEGELDSGILYQGSIHGDATALLVPACRNESGIDGVRRSSSVLKIPGSDKLLTASLYLPSSTDSRFDFSLSVFQGNCEILECQNTGEYWDSSLSSPTKSPVVSWQSEPGKEYFVLVSRCCGGSVDSEYVLIIEYHENHQLFEEGGLVEYHSNQHDTEDVVIPAPPNIIQADNKARIPSVNEGENSDAIIRKWSWIAFLTASVVFEMF